jgi:prepilin-type N-terminal cleavage/methylation domain-containing protein
MPKKNAFSLIELSIVILIIGILIAGVTQGSRLIREMRFASAQSITKSSDVNSIPDLAIWLETTSEKSFITDRPEDGDAIQTWYDINPRILETLRINATQATSGSRPLYKVGVINSLPVLRFDGTDDSMSVADGFDNDSENVTLFLVWKSNVPTSNLGEMDLLEKWHQGASGYPYVLRSSSSGGGEYRFNAYDGANNPSVVSTTLRTPSSASIINARRSKNGVMNLWVNGNKEGGDVTDNTTTTAGSSANNDTLGICVRPTVGFVCNGDIGEIIIFSRALKEAERKSVENYLGKKWGIRVP